jgi:hypothetical protein
MIADELLQITSFRIPTSSHVSASQVEIAGFLPPEAGDLMIVPKEFAAQKGLDYDIDKEFSYHLWHALNDDGTISNFRDVHGPNLDSKIARAKVALDRIKSMMVNQQDYAQKINTIIDNAELTGKEKDHQILIATLSEFDNEDYLKEVTEKDLEKVYNAYKTLLKTKKKILQNEIVDINRAVLGSDNTAIQRKINRVLSMDFAEGQAKMLEEKSYTFTSLLSDSYQQKKMNLGSVGQMAIGVYSNYEVLASLMQQNDKDIIARNEDGEAISIKIGGFTSNGVMGRYVNILDPQTVDVLKEIAGNDTALKIWK